LFALPDIRHAECRSGAAARARRAGNVELDELITRRDRIAHREGEAARGVITF
jgi:hypothetical protein